MRTNQFELPVRDALWINPERIVKVDYEQYRIALKCESRMGEITLYISFPQCGGIRIHTGTEGFFKPETCAGYKHRSDSGITVIDSENGSALKIETAEHRFTLQMMRSGGQKGYALFCENIQLGYIDGECRKAAIVSTLAEDEVIYGFGERFNTFNHRGTHFTLWNADQWSQGTTAYKNMPVYHSTAGYMMFFNSTYSCEADVGELKSDLLRMEFEGPIWDTYIFSGTPAENILSYTGLTGKPILPPEWVFRYWAGGGYQVWEEKGADRYLTVLEECMQGYEKLGIYDLAAVFGEGAPFHNKPAYEILARTGTRMLAWNHPSLMIEDMKKLLDTDDLDEIPYIMDPRDRKKQATREVIDFTHKNAVRVISEFFKEFWDWGLKGCMVDYGEILPVDSVASNGMTGDEMHNFVSYWYNKAYHDAWTERMGSDYILFSRSGCAGCQRWVANFGGDQVADFDGLNKAFNGMLNLCACGFSFWGTDLGGYGGSPVPEVYIRWLQFATFNPLMRAHGIGGDRNPWSYGEQAVRVFSKLYALRENLLPYIYEKAVYAHETGIPIVKSMPIAFPQSEEAQQCTGQFLFGDDLLVCPVLEEFAVTKTVYLPRGEWYGLFDGQTVIGNGLLKVPVTIEDIPVYIRSGSIIPLRVNSECGLFGMIGKKKPSNALLITPPDDHVQVQSGFFDEESIYEMSSQKGEFLLKRTGKAEIKMLVLYGIKPSGIKIDGEAPEVAEPVNHDNYAGYTLSLNCGNWMEIVIETDDSVKGR